MSEMVDQETGDCEPKATGSGSVRNVNFVGHSDMGITLSILMCFVDPYKIYVLYVNECVLILKSKSFVFHTKMFAISRSFRLSTYLSGFRRCLSQSSPPGPRILAAIDFDKTIVQEDSYLAVSQLLPIGQSKELQDQIPKCGWLGFIGRVLELLHSEHKVDSASVGMRVRRLQAVPGMLRVVRRLARNPAVDRASSAMPTPSSSASGCGSTPSSASSPACSPIPPASRRAARFWCCPTRSRPTASCAPRISARAPCWRSLSAADFTGGWSMWATAATICAP